MYTLKQFLAALKPTGKIAVDLGGEGVTGSPSWIKLTDTAGVVYYLFVDTTGDLRIHTAVPTSDSDGSVVGGQS